MRPGVERRPAPSASSTSSTVATLKMIELAPAPGMVSRSGEVLGEVFSSGTGPAIGDDAFTVVSFEAQGDGGGLTRVSC